jgi:hypothetical protein
VEDLAQAVFDARPSVMGLTETPRNAEPIDRLLAAAGREFCSRLPSRHEFSFEQVKKPSIVSILLALIPFCGMCFSVPFWDRVTPMVAGLPFNLFWMIAWIAVTPVLMSLVYWIERRR